MNRKPPEDLNHNKLLPPEVVKQSDCLERTMTIGEEKTTVIVQTRQYKLITPLFGGGVKPGVNDPDNLIRGTEIRGQLRFWWRAIRGGQFGGDLAKMKKREDEIWGAASNTEEQKNLKKEDIGEKKVKWKEVVQIRVEIQDCGKTQKPYIPQWNAQKTKIVLQSNPEIPSYAAFPLRPSDDELKQAKYKGGPEHVFVEDVRNGVVFLLHLSFPQIWSTEIEATLWAWETFGGIGARTRRGFGALLLQEIDANKIKDVELSPANPNEAKIWIRMKIQQYMGAHENQYVAHVPYIKATLDMQNMRILGPSTQPAELWKKLIDPLFAFRQQRFDFREQRSSSFGTSLWPEANALRKRLHADKNQSNTPDKLPRAAFGLPIVFHLPHEKPVTTITLQGTQDARERFASRLILKPIPCRSKRFLGIAILLDGSALPEDDLALIRDGKPWKTIPVEQTRLKPREVPGLDNVLGTETDVLKAFMNYLKKEDKSL